MRSAEIDLDIYGTPIRVICEEREGADRLRTLLEPHLSEEPAEPGFVIHAPGPGTRLRALLDRSGLVLARSQSLDDCIQVMLGHLGLFAPPPADTMRLKVRALVRSADGSAVLAWPPLFVDPPAVERRLERAGFALVDRLAVDLSRDARELCLAAPLVDLSSVVDGHHSGPGRHTIERCLVPEGTPGSTAGAVAQVASTIMPSSDHGPDERLDLAEALVARGLEHVPLDQRAARYRALG